MPLRILVQNHHQSLMDQPATIWSQCLDYATLSDVGQQRVNNQDSFAATLADNQTDFERRGHLFLVADGMGAHAAGELASKMAADIISLVYRKRPDRLPTEAILAAILSANHQIHSRGQASPDFHGMGTTVTTLLLLPAGAVLAHVGDSRAYRWRNHRIEQLTFDHSLVWEMRAAGQFANNELPSYISKNIITRSLGPHPSVKIDLEGPHPIQPGDAFLLCSDGLSNQVADEEIGLALGCLPSAEAAQALVDIANFRGGPDNITIVTASVRGPQVAQGANEAAPPAKVPSNVRPVHPSIWVLIGVAAFSGCGLLALDCVGPALLGFLAAGIGVVALLVRHILRVSERISLENRRFGRGPYVAGDCRPNAELLGRLNEIVQRLKAAALKERCPVDWNTFEGYQTRTTAATQSGNLTEVAQELFRSISFLSEQLRQHRSVAAGADSSIIGLEMSREDEEEEE